MTLSEPAPATVPAAEASARRRRGARSCESCRIKKLRCDESKPQCQNCYRRSIACEYLDRPKKPRPSNARIAQLSQQNAALEAKLQEQQAVAGSERATRSTPSTNSSTAISNSTPSTGTSQDGSNRLPPTVPDEEAAEANGPDQQYHGPTSAMFDALTLEDGAKMVPLAMAEGHQRALLTAETLKQRHLESINARRGKLDFGDVPTEFGMILLKMFWNRQYATGCVVYRPTFMRDMANGGPYFSPLLLHAMLLYSIRCAATTPGLDSSSEPIRRKFDELLYRDHGRTLTTSRLTTIQALLLMSDVLFAWLDERSLAWQYLGIATQMIIDLGMHSEHKIPQSADLDQLQWLESRRRTFWAAFVLDKVQSIYQGRPPRLRDFDCNVPILFLDDFEELEPYRTDGYSAAPTELRFPSYAVSQLSALCSLAVVADHILQKLYGEKLMDVVGEDTYNPSQQLQRELDEWHQLLPDHLAMRHDSMGIPVEKSACEALPHLISLQSMFYSLEILTHRPFTSYRRLDARKDSGSKLSSSQQACSRPAVMTGRLLELYKTQFCLKSPPFVVTYATYVSATVHVRNCWLDANYETGPSYKPLLDCLDILSQQKKTNRAAARSLEILEEMIRTLNIDTTKTPVVPASWDMAGDFVALGPSDFASLDAPVWLGTAQAGSDVQNVAPAGRNLSDTVPDSVMGGSEVSELYGHDLLVGFQAPEYDYDDAYNYV